MHCGGTFYEFVPWNGFVEWEIAPWGYWKISADNGSYLVRSPVMAYSDTISFSKTDKIIVRYEVLFMRKDWTIQIFQV